MKQKISLLIGFLGVVLFFNIFLVFFGINFDQKTSFDEAPSVSLTSGTEDLSSVKLVSSLNEGSTSKNYESLSFSDGGGSEKKTKKVKEKEIVTEIVEEEETSSKQLFEYYVSAEEFGVLKDFSYKEFTEFIKNDLKFNPSYTWVPFGNYERFEVYVDEPYLNNNQENLTQFFSDFTPRFDLLESTTGWSSEEFYGQKLQIYVAEAVGGCAGGSGDEGLAFFQFSDPLYESSCLAPGGIGELGDTWRYMGVAIHEATHAINPVEIQNRAWIREGLGRYYEYNLLSEYGDITQEMVDEEIYQGDSYYNWEDYVGNDYHDTCTAGAPWCVPNEAEIQESNGYAITAWLFSMLRDDYDLNWNLFYDLVDENYNALEEAYSVLGNYVTDTVILEMFTRSSDATFETFQYDGPSGPGWGVRHIENVDWYADLTPELFVSKSNPVGGEVVDVGAEIFNNGGIDSNNVSVRFYAGDEFFYEEFVNVPEGSSIVVDTPGFTRFFGSHTIEVRVDEDNLKIEMDENNNKASSVITFQSTQPDCTSYFDKRLNRWITICR